MGQYFSVLNDDDDGGIEYSDLTQNIPTVQAVDVSLNELFGNEEPNADLIQPAGRRDTSLREI